MVGGGLAWLPCSPPLAGRSSPSLPSRMARSCCASSRPARQERVRRAAHRARGAIAVTGVTPETCPGAVMPSASRSTCAASSALLRTAHAARSPSASTAWCRHALSGVMGPLACSARSPCALGVRVAPSWRGAWGCRPAPTPCCASCGRAVTAWCRPHACWASMTSPCGVASGTGPSCSILNATGLSTCSPAETASR